MASPKDTAATTLTMSDLQLIKQLIHEELAAADEHRCRLNISDDAAREMGHWAGALRDLGEGDLRKGIEITRENHRWLFLARLKSDKLSSAIMTVVLVTLTGGLLTAVWAGIRVLLSEGGK